MGRSGPAESECPCGNRLQTMEYILQVCTIGPSYSDTDLREHSPTATTQTRLKQQDMKIIMNINHDKITNEAHDT